MINIILKLFNPLSGMGGVFVLQKGKANSLFANVASDPVPPGSKLTIMKKYSYLAEGCAPEIGVGTLVSAKTVRQKKLCLYLF